MPVYHLIVTLRYARLFDKLIARRTIGNRYASSRAQIAEESRVSTPALQYIETLLPKAVTDLCTIGRVMGRSKSIAKK